MFQHVNPIGISISQAKKDAKKLAKNKDISLSQAQDKIAFQHNRSTWAEQTRQTNQVIKLDFKDSLLGSQHITLPLPASVNFVVGQSGTGKSVLCYEMMAQIAKQNIPVTYITKGVGRRITSTEAPEWAVYHNMLFDVQDKYPSLIHIHDVDVEFNAESVQLRGGILIVDEVWNTLKVTGLPELLKASKHTFLVAQVFGGISHLPPEILQPEAMQAFLFTMPSYEIEKIKHLHTLPLDELKLAFAMLKPVRDIKSSFLVADNKQSLKLYELKKENFTL